MTVRVRVDDVLISSSDPKMKGREFHQFKKYHNWIQIAPNHLFHTPAILVKEIQQFPEAIKFIKEELTQGRLFPILHGLEHVDYGKMKQTEIEAHLDEALSWMEKTFEVSPTIFAVPWGARSDEIEKAARKFSLEVEGVDGPVLDVSVAHSLVRDAGVASLRGRVILCHSWERGLRLYRIAQSFKYGSYQEAAKHCEGF